MLKQILKINIEASIVAMRSTLVLMRKHSSVTEAFTGLYIDVSFIY